MGQQPAPPPEEEPPDGDTDSEERPAKDTFSEAPGEAPAGEAPAEGGSPQVTPPGAGPVRPAPAEETRAPAGPGPAGLGPRALARLVDALIVFVPASLVLTAVGLPAPTLGVGGLEAWAHSAITAALWLAYHAVMEAGEGATLGKKMLGLQVIATSGGTPSAGAAATRNVWILFGLVPFLGGVAQLLAVIVITVTIAGSDTHRGKHDEIAGTAVVV